MNEKADKLRRRMLKPWTFKAFLWAKLPLGAASGMRLVELDDRRCVVALPGGWRTQNPFRSTYFAAQAMAAEMSTGAPGFVLTGGSPVSVAMLVREIRGEFTRRIQGTSTFTFDGVAEMAAAVERAAASDEPVTFTGVSIGRTREGEEAARFEVTWSFKRRS